MTSFNPIVDHNLLSNNLTSPTGTAISGQTGAANPFTYGDVIPIPFADVQVIGQPLEMEALLRTYHRDSNPIPSDITKFVKDYVSRFSNPPDPATVNAILTGFLQTFQQSITGRQLPAIAWPELASNITLTGDISDPKQFSQLEAAFKSFTKTYPYTSTGEVGVLATANSAYTSFMTGWRNFNAFSATIKNNSGGTLDTPFPFSSTSGFAVVTYQTIFNNFYPAYATPAIDPSSPTGETYFAQYLQRFYESEVVRHGFFSPSHSLTNWVGYVQDLAGITLAPTTRVPETKTLIINNVILLLIQMITSIQNIAAAQAKRLELYSTWQRGYTSLLGQVHVFTDRSIDRLNYGGEEGDAKVRTDVRRDIQTNFNAAVTQRLTSQKDVVTDDAKALQSRVNQSSDAFNEQANVVTALLQTLSTLLSTIFR